jgi:subtilisin family serine protease
VAPGGGLPTDPFPETPLNRYVLAACSVHGVNRPCGTTTYDFVEGTSFAAPMVAGAAALVISSSPRFKGHPQQVKAQLVQTADDLGEKGADNLFSKGRLNTLRAVQEAIRTIVPLR